MLCPGDLLFPSYDAISDVTVGWCDAGINHVAICIAPTIVIEAIEPTVRQCALRRFLQQTLDARRRPRVLVGRPVASLRGLIPHALAWTAGRVGRPYDKAFGSGKEAYYCSKLVVDAFKHANGGISVFKERPMSFSDPATGEVHPYWATYFDVLGLPIPEGEAGSNLAVAVAGD